MTHLSEDDLALHYYGEHEDTAGVAAHIEACPACRAADEALRADLAAVILEPPARGVDYGAHVWERIQPRLGRDRVALASVVRRPVVVRRASALLALAASLVVAFLLGRHTSAPEDTGKAAAEVRHRILLVAVGDHLERSQTVLVELAHVDPGDPTDVPARAARLVAENRLYRQTAERSGHAGLAAVLDDLERVLVEVAHTPEPLTAEDVSMLKQRIEARELLFRIRVLGSRLRVRRAGTGEPWRGADSAGLEG